MNERVIELIDDLVVHRPAELRVRVQDDRDRRVLLARGMIPALDPSCGTGENDFRHCVTSNRTVCVGMPRRAALFDCKRRRLFSWLERGFNPQFRIILIIGIPLFTAAIRAISCLENGKRMRVSSMTRRAKSKLFEPSTANNGTRILLVS